MFISWSGETSHEVAKILYGWLLKLKIPSLELYISDEIDKGALWFAELVSELKSADCGILCLTKENVAAPWLLFEAGALLTAKEGSFVSPFLFRVNRSEIAGPLAQFQHTECTREDIKSLVRRLNKSCGEKRLSQEEFESAFARMYPELAEKLQNVPEIRQAVPENPPLDENALQILRDMRNRLDNLLP